jgi:DNA polymerase-3 subunit delta'
MFSEAEAFADPGQEQARRAVRSALAQDRMPHALLLTGEEGVGKADFARWAVAAAWCRQGDSGQRPCGGCASCLKVASGNHPDLMVVARGDEELGSRHEITVNQVRLGVIPALGLRPVEAPARAVIVVDVDEMNEGAQNALLKTLEEPPAGTLLLLTTAREDVLLETIHSRCHTLRLQPLDEGAMDRDGVHPPARVRLARGRPGRLDALAALDVDGLLAALDDVLARRHPGSAFAAAALAVTEDGEGDRLERQRLALDVLRTRLRDLALHRSGASETALTGAPEAIEALPGVETLLALDEALLEAAEDLRRHLPAEVAWTVLGSRLATAAGGVRTAADP